MSEVVNDRIRELLSEAGVHYEFMPKDTVYEKFAHLIIKECIANCDDLNSMKYIANHFGITIEGLE